MFPDSKYATKFCSAKTTCIVKGALYPHFSVSVESICRDGPFLTLCDEGNDTDMYFSILVQLWDERVCMPATKKKLVMIYNITLLMLKVFLTSLMKLGRKEIFHSQMLWVLNQIPVM